MSEADPEDWDRWMSLTEEQQNRELEIATKRYNDMIDSMTRLQYYRHCRASTVRAAVAYRKILRDFPDWEFMKNYLRARQRRMVMIRAAYYHSTDIGNA